METEKSTEDLLFLAQFMMHNKPAELLGKLIIPSICPIVITDAGELDGHYKIVYANPTFCKNVGYELAELVGQSPSMFQGPKSNRVVLDRLKNDLKTTGYFHGASVNYRKDGSHYPVEWNISPIKNNDGEIKYFVSMQKDLSALLYVSEQVIYTNEKVRAFLADLDGNTLDEKQRERKQELTELLKDNAKLYSAPLETDKKLDSDAVADNDDTDLFDDAFFDFTPEQDEGILANREEKPVISAVDYMSEERMSADDVRELLEVLESLRGEIEFLQHDPTQTSRINEVATHVNELSDAIFYLIDFTDTAMALVKVSECLRDMTDKPLNSVFPIVLLALVDEMENWLNSVFLEQTATNIYEGETMIIAASQQIVSSAGH